MKKFRFRLEKVLTARESVETMRAQALAIAQIEVQRAQEELKRGLEERDRYRELVKGRQFDEVDVFSVSSSIAFIHMLETRLTAAANRLVELARRVPPLRAKLLAASKDKKILENLRDRQSGAHRKWSAKKEAKGVEVLITQAHASGERQ
jgi:flagellar export protein FliJ